MEAAFVRNLKSGQLFSTSPLQFIRVPIPGEAVQLGNVVWVVNSVVHAWRSPTDPICEIRVLAQTREDALPLENSVHQ